MALDGTYSKFLRTGGSLGNVPQKRTTVIKKAIFKSIDRLILLDIDTLFRINLYTLEDGLIRRNIYRVLLSVFIFCGTSPSEPPVLKINMYIFTY